jgi:hypothetical protein
MCVSCKCDVYVALIMNTTCMNVLRNVDHEREVYRVQCCSWSINHMTNKWDDEELNSCLEGKNTGVFID